jgi:hypothetical protein
VNNWIDSLKFVSEETSRYIRALHKALPKEAKPFFTKALNGMMLGGAKKETRELLPAEIVETGRGLAVVQRTRVRKFSYHRLAWRERLDELRALLPVFEQVDISSTKNFSKGVNPRRRVDRRPLHIGEDEDPAIQVDQINEESKIILGITFLSGRVAKAEIVFSKDQPMRFRAIPKDKPYFLPLKERIREAIKFGVLYSPVNSRLSPEQLAQFRRAYNLGFPCLLSNEDLNELKGLIAAEKVMLYMDISKTSKGKARRGTRESIRLEKFSEEDMFREARAAKSIQKRTNRDPRLGIGEYAGGWDADPELDIEDEKPTWPSKQDKALGLEHPARHFRLSLFAMKKWVTDEETGEDRYEWAWESGPVTLDKKTMGITRLVSKKSKYPLWKIQDVRGLKERIYQELEWGDLLFWAESYRGNYGYPFYNKETGIYLPSKVPSYRHKVHKPQLPCKQCGGKLWRLDLQAQVCDTCGSEGFPRNWMYVLIPAWRLARYCTYEKGTTHIQVKLYGRAVGWVIREAIRRKMDISKPHIEMDYRGNVNKVQAAVGFGRLIWGPDWQIAHPEVVVHREPHRTWGRRYVVNQTWYKPVEPHKGHPERFTQVLDIKPVPQGFKWVNGYLIKVK